MIKIPVTPTEMFYLLPTANKVNYFINKAKSKRPDPTTGFRREIKVEKNILLMSN